MMHVGMDVETVGSVSKAPTKEHEGRTTLVEEHRRRSLDSSAGKGEVEDARTHARRGMEGGGEGNPPRAMEGGSGAAAPVREPGSSCPVHANIRWRDVPPSTNIRKGISCIEEETHLEGWHWVVEINSMG